MQGDQTGISLQNGDQIHPVPAQVCRMVPSQCGALNPQIDRELEMAWRPLKQNFCTSRVLKEVKFKPMVLQMKILGFREIK